MRKSREPLSRMLLACFMLGLYAACPLTTSRCSEKYSHPRNDAGIGTAHTRRAVFVTYRSTESTEFPSVW